MKVVKDEIDISRYMSAEDDGEMVLPASNWLGEHLDLVRSGGVIRKQGSKLGWAKTHDFFRFVPGGVTLWLGINGHGKSLVTSQVQVDLMMQDEPCGLASLEMKPLMTLDRMSRQAFGGRGVTEEFIEHFHSWTDGRFWIYDKHGNTDWKRIIACGRYMASQGVKHFFVDSLMKCIRGEDDYNAQKDFVAGLCGLAEETGMHCHLIHHSRKLDDETKRPGKFDAKGTGSITDQVDNVLSVWRNKTKEKLRESGKDYDPKTPDVELIIDKQRHNGGWEGAFMFWYDTKSMQYLPNYSAEVQRYFPELYVEEIL